MIETENPEYFVAQKENGDYCIISKNITVDEGFAYLSYAFEDYFIFTDKNGFVIEKETVPGNIHDSVSFFPVYNSLNKKFKDKIKNVCLDSAYFTLELTASNPEYNDDIVGNEYIEGIVVKIFGIEVKIYLGSSRYSLYNFLYSLIPVVAL